MIVDFYGNHIDLVFRGFFFLNEVGSLKCAEHVFLTLLIRQKIFCHTKLFSIVLRILARKKHPQTKTPALMKGMNMNIWVVGTSNQLFLRSS